MSLRRFTEDGSTQSAGVFIEDGALGAHIGVFHREDGSGVVRLLHQAWHHATLHERAEITREFFLVADNLDRFERSNLAAAARNTAAALNEGGIPFAIAVRDANNVAGQISLNSSSGLTCATFTMLLFESAHVALLDRGSWAADRPAERVREDASAASQIAAELRSSKDLGKARQAARVDAESAEPRFRAEEVAAATTLHPRPVGFTAAAREGANLLASLRAMLATPSQKPSPPTNAPGV